MCQLRLTLQRVCWLVRRAAFLLLLGMAPSSAIAEAAVRYNVSFNATWSAATHPGAYPGGAHFSALIGGVHSPAAGFWAPGGIASGGMELMAERGGTSLLAQEVQRAITAGVASSVIRGPGALSPDSVSTEFEVSSAFPLVTLVTMVAPSPDWFVGVHDLDLRQGGRWVDSWVVDLRAYDAGTDDGAAFTSTDIEANPRQPIALLGAPFATVGPVLGQFVFTRLTPVPEAPAWQLLAATAIAVWGLVPGLLPRACEQSRG